MKMGQTLLHAIVINGVDLQAEKYYTFSTDLMAHVSLTLLIDGNTLATYCFSRVRGINIDG